MGIREELSNRVFVFLGDQKILIQFHYAAPDWEEQLERYRKELSPEDFYNLETAVLKRKIKDGSENRSRREDRRRG